MKNGTEKEWSGLTDMKDGVKPVRLALRGLPALCLFVFLLPVLVFGEAVIDNDGGASNVTASTATLNGNLISTGGVSTTAYVFWNVADNSTNISDWAHTNSFGVKPAGFLATNVTGLLPNQAYYYRFYATNATGASWALSTTNFTTKGPPSVDNDDGASEIAATSASLNGNLISDGGTSTTVYVYWGTNNGGTVKSAWEAANSFSLVASGSPLTTNITGLASNMFYYYRFYATNTYGESWASTNETFQTWGAAAVNNDGGASNVTGSGATLNGNLTSGSPVPNTYVYYGSTDGGTNESGWNKVAVGVGTTLGFFSEIVSSGLIANRTNYYRCHAANAMGSAWADSTTNFWVPAPLLSIDNVLSDKIISGTTSAVFTVSLSLPSDVDVSVNYATSNGIAQAGTHYEAKSGLLIIPAGTPNATITVTVNAEAESDGLSKNFYVNLSNPTNAVLVVSRGHGTILDYRTPRVFLTGTRNGVINASTYHVVIPSDITVGDPGYLVVYAKSITMINNAGIMAYSKGFGGGGGGSGAMRNPGVTYSGLPGGTGHSHPRGEAGSDGATDCTYAGDGGDGGGTASSENWVPTYGLSGMNAGPSGAPGGGGGKGGGQYGGYGGLGGAATPSAGGAGKPGGYNGYNATSNGINNEASIGVFFPGTPVSYTNYSIFRGSGSGGGGGGGAKTGNGTSGGSGGAAGGAGYGASGLSASGGGGGGTAGGGAIVLRALSGPLDLGCAGTFNACGAAGSGSGGSGAGGGVCLVGPDVVLGAGVIVTNLGGSLSANGGTLKLWYHSTGTLATNGAAYSCGKVFPGTYGPSINNDGGASNVTASSATLHGNLMATGGAPTTVYVYWGPVNGGTVPGSWANSINLGVLGPGGFSTNIYNLTANKTYYYRTFAVNSESYHWAQTSTNFTTLPPTVQFVATNSSGSEASTLVNLPVTITVTSAVDVTVNYTVESGSASNGLDYALTNGVITISAGTTSKNISFSVTNDQLDEYDETIHLLLSGPASATLGANTNHTYTILDNDNPPVMAFSGEPYVVDESGGSRTVTITISAASGKNVSLDYATSDGTATNGVDYTNTVGTLTWTAGETATKTFAVPIIDDAILQPEHTINLTLSNSVNCTLGESNTVIMIIDNDNPADLKVFFLGEPFGVDEWSTNAVISVKLNGTSGSPITVDYRTWAGNATPDTDYTNVTGTLTWTVGQSGIKTFTVPVVGDVLDEWDETIHVQLTNTVGATIGGNTNTTITIFDDDAFPVALFTNTPYSVAESGTNVTVFITLNEASGRDVAVNYTATDGTATDGTDYTSVTGMLTWSAGETGAKTFMVSVIEDVLDEYDETIIVTLSSPSNVTIDAANPTTITITDNDVLPAVFFTNAPYTVVEDCTNVTVYLVLSAMSGRPVSVNYATSDGTATNNLDYTHATGTVTWTAGATHVGTFTIPIINNTVFQTNRTINVTLSDPGNCTISGSSTTTVTIVDNDGLIVGNSLGAWKITSVHATLRGEVIEANGSIPPTVRIYWGPTDGGNNPFNWANAMELGTLEVGTFSATISNLIENQIYYYTTYATRGGDNEAWASASENFLALDPPVLVLLQNGGMETAGSTTQNATNWTALGSALPVRNDAFPRTGSWSMRFPVQSGGGNYVYGTRSNDFRISWNGQVNSGAVQARGGIRPGFVLSGNAFIRSGLTDYDAAIFTYKLQNVDTGIAWHNMASTKSTTSTLYTVISISDATPSVSPSDIHIRCRPQLSRDSGITVNSTDFYADDFGLSASLPKLSLQYNPADVLAMPDTKVGSSNSITLGARNFGGGENTVLYGVYITNAIDFTNSAWSQTGWSIYNDPSNAFNIVTGATLAATEGSGYQSCTFRFTPPSAGSFTGMVRIATTDPDNHYTNGGVANGIVYNEYTLIGTGVTPPAVDNDGGATSIEGQSATLRGQVLSTGWQDPTVRFYWGRTDGGTTFSLWSNVTEIGTSGVGLFSTNLTGLRFNSLYFYRAYGINMAGGSWASFTTNFITPPGPPEVSNVAGAIPGMTVATLTGNLVSTGGTNCTVRIYWGASNGLTNDASWSNIVNMGDYGADDEGAFSAYIVGLAQGSSYWYTCYATSTIAGTWASPSTNFTTLIDTDGDGMPDVWETAYGFDPNNNSDAATDFDMDGVVNRDEYTGGTNPTNATSYLRFISMDVANVNDISFSIFAGEGRILLINSADQAASNKSVLASSLTTVSGTNGWTDVNAVNLTPHRYYTVGVSYDESGYTNTEEWAMHVQNRPANQRFLICVPVDYGSTNAANLNSTLGAQLARGLYASDDTNNADRIRYLNASNTWREFYTLTNSSGQFYWYDPDTGGTAAVPVTAGTAFWVVRGTNSAARSNAVFTGKSFTEASAAPLAFHTNYSGWTMFGWPLAQPRRHRNTEATSGMYSTPPNQLDFYAVGTGGRTVDPNRSGERGDQLWVWRNNTWEKFYWLIGNVGANWDGRWWDENASDFADFSLDPGQAYYYRHPTNFGATNFVWTPQNE